MAHWQVNLGRKLERLLTHELDAAGCHRVGLLDEVVVSIAPVTLGAGAPLLPRRVELEVLECARNGEFVCVRYDVVRG